MKLARLTRLSRAVHLLLHPSEFVRRLNGLRLERKISNAAKNPFFMQSQMDINQKSNWYAKEFINQTGGYLVAGDSINRVVETLEPWDIVRRDMIILLLRSIVVRKVMGNLAELGVYKGLTARLIHHYLPERTLHLFDTFSGFDKKDLVIELSKTGVERNGAQFSDSSLDEVVLNIEKRNDNVNIYKGHFPESIPVELHAQRFAFVHIDVDLYEPTLTGLNFFYNKLSEGGCLLVHDYNAWIGVRKAVDEFCQKNQCIALPMPDKSGSALIIKGR